MDISTAKFYILHIKAFRRGRFKVLSGNTVGFDLNEASEALRAFSEACMVSALILSDDGQVLYRNDKAALSCDSCRRIRDLCGAGTLCEDKVHVYGSFEAERFGGRYIYFCPAGFVYFASPVTSGGVLKGALVGGPVLMVDKDDFIENDILKKYAAAPELRGEIAEILSGAREDRPERVSGLSYLLFTLAAFISSIEYSKLKDRAEAGELQSAINSYVQEYKLSDTNPLYPIEKEGELDRAIADGNRQLAGQLLNELLGFIFFSTGGDISVIRVRVTELVVLLSRAAIRGGADAGQALDLNHRYLREVGTYQDIEQLSLWLSRVMARFMDIVFNFTEARHSDVIHKAVSFINNNYMRKTSLEDAARSVYLSPSYFSRIFKEETGRSFNSYLNSVRVEKSKILLTSTEHDIITICAMVGFEDQSYFSKVFKKIAGIPPGKFRERRGRASLDRNAEKAVN